MDKKNEIKLVQIPIITHKLQEVGKEVTRRLDEMNIDKLVATNETVKSLKELRADLNKELKGFEDQRKMIKNGVNNPYLEFEAVYKIEISEKFSNAISKLKEKISSVEIKIKEEKEGNVKLYFVELCQSENIDFVIFSNVGLEINLTTTEKAYKQKCNDFIQKVVDDIKLIKSQQFEAEIMVEYKNDLNVSSAITVVSNRKVSEKEETERIKQVEWQRRIAEFLKIEMKLDEETKTFQYNNEIYIGSEPLKELSKEDFSSRIIEFDEKIKAFNKVKPIDPAMDFKVTEKEPVSEQQELKPETIKKPLGNPVVEEKLETVTASFEVKGTLPQLKALGEYMKSNNITYKNI